MAFHSENFVSVRRLYPLVTARVKSRLEVADPASTDERDYRDLLSEANLNFFHREYTIALQNYMSLRQKILEQSHPELPRIPGAGGLWALEWSKVQLDRIVEFARRSGGTVTPGDRVRSRLGDSALIREGEFRADPQLARWSSVGIDTRPAASDPNLRDRARTLVKEAKFDEAARQYTAAAEAALAAGQTELAADIHNESAVMLATYASGATRTATLRQSLESLTRAEQLYARAGNTDAVAVIRTNRTNIDAEIPNPPTPQPPGPGGPGGPRPIDPVIPGPGPLIPGGGIRIPRDLATATLRAGTLISASPRISQIQVRLPAEQTTRQLVLRDAGAWQIPGDVLAQREATVVTAKQYGMFRPDGSTILSLAQADWSNQLRAQVYQPRVAATTLDAIRFYEEVDVNFIAYHVHLTTTCCQSRLATRMLRWDCSSRASPSIAACFHTPSSTWGLRGGICG